VPSEEKVEHIRKVLRSKLVYSAKGRLKVRGRQIIVTMEYKNMKKKVIWIGF
jgi:hypothetical protein